MNTHKLDKRNLEPNIWGPHYWFVLHTISYTYPIYPNDEIKQKYYSFIQLLPLLLPDGKSSRIVSNYINNFSVVPYLDSKESFITYINRLHNHINVYLGKQVFLTNTDSNIEYFKQYNKELMEYEKKKNQRKYFKKLLLITIIIVILTITLLLYKYS